MKNFNKGIGLELRHAFGSKEFFISLCSIFVILIVNIMLTPNFAKYFKLRTVYEYYMDLFYGMPIRMSLFVCSIPYGLSICEDLEYRYIYQILSRINGRQYLMQRMIAIFLSSWAAMTISLTVFALVMHYWVPWCDFSDANYILNVTESGGFYDSLMKRNEILFFLMYSLHFSMLSGILSVVAAGISILIPNRLFILSVPFLVIYLSLDLSITKGNSAINIWQYYDVLGYAIYNDYHVVYQGILLTMAIFLFTYLLSCHLLKRRLANG